MMVDLERAGLYQLSRLQQKKKEKAQSNQKSMSFISILMTFYTIGIILASYLQPSMAIAFGQQAVNGFIHQCNAIDANFDGTLNSIPHMKFAMGKCLCNQIKKNFGGNAQGNFCA